MLFWLNKKLEKGFYFPVFIFILTFLEKISINFWIKKYIINKGFTDISRKKSPRWVAELIQCIFLIFGFLSIIFLEELSVNEGFKWLFIFLLGYRLFEILIFTGNWIFVHDVDLHSYRRSIAGFTLNVLEISLYVSVISLLGNCEISDSKFAQVSRHLKGIITFDMPELNKCLGCQMLSLGELILSTLLILVVVAALVGRIMRKEIGK